MGADEKLYSLLAGDQDIPWGLAAGQFLAVKVASGGLYPDEAQEICKVVLAAAAKEDGGEQVRKALEQGAISGLRSIPAGDIASVGRATRTRGTRIGDVLGMAGGTAAGLLATKGGAPSSKAVGAMLGALGGKTLGKAVGTEIDSARARARLKNLYTTKAATIEKRAEEKKKFSLTPVQKAALIGAGLGAVGGGVAGGMYPGHVAKRVQATGSALVKAYQEGQPLDLNQKAHTLRFLTTPLKELTNEHLLESNAGFTSPAGNAITGALLGAGVGALTGAAGATYLQNRKAGIEQFQFSRAQRDEIVKKYGPQIASDLGFKKKASVLRVMRALTKVADQPFGDSTITSPVTPLPAETQLTRPEQTPLHPEIEQQLNRMQQTNEADFYRQQAEEAQAAAEQGKQRVEELIQQLNMLNQQSQMQTAQDQQVRQMAEQQAQMASQDATMARDESLQAQQQNMQLRTAVTQFRQALMNLVAQDPTTAMGPPPVQTGPMPQPGAPQEAMPPEAGPPGVPPGAPPEAPAQVAPPAPVPPAPEMKPPEPMKPPAPAIG